MPRALILGVGGQDGAYLARLLVARGVDVTGTTRGEPKLARLADLQITNDVVVRRLDALEDPRALIATSAPDEIYDLRGPGPDEPTDADALVSRTRALLAATGGARMLVAGAGNDAAFDGGFIAAKEAAGDIVAAARADGAFAVTARLSEHESRLSSRSTATHLIARAQAARGEDVPPLKTPERLHDWGWAPEYVDALRRLLAASRPTDHDVASGLEISEAIFAAHAAEFFGTAGAVDDDLIAAPRALSLVPGWRAFTYGRDLVRTLCEGIVAV